MSKLKRTASNLYAGLRIFVTSHSIHLRMRNFSVKFVQNMKNTQIIFNKFLTANSFFCGDNVETHGTARQATDGNIRVKRRMHFACWILQARIQTDKQS
jgi:hypothetical protein